MNTYMSVMVPRAYSEELCTFVGNIFQCNFFTEDFGDNHSRIHCDKAGHIINKHGQAFYNLVDGFHKGWEIGQESRNS